MWSSIVINWQGRKLTGEQMLVLQRVAAQFADEAAGTAYAFEHPLCEGVLKCKGPNTLGTFSGLVFNAYLGTIDNEPWTHEFMLLEGFDEHEFPDDIPMSRVEVSEKGMKVTAIEKEKAAGAKAHKIRMQ